MNQEYGMCLVRLKRERERKKDSRKKNTTFEMDLNKPFVVKIRSFQTNIILDKNLLEVIFSSIRIKGHFFLH